MTKHRGADLWKQEVRARRIEKDRRRHLPMRPLVSPPAMRRRMALLWFIATAFDGSMEVGWMYRPPMTEDMKWLVRLGYLRLERRRIPGGRHTRGTVISLTNAGVSASATSRLNESDARWIEAAYMHDMLM